jgi:hypothetical protein
VMLAGPNFTRSSLNAAGELRQKAAEWKSRLL